MIVSSECPSALELRRELLLLGMDRLVQGLTESSSRVDITGVIIIVTSVMCKKNVLE